MSESVTISRTEWNEFMKRFSYLESFVKNSLKTTGKNRWMTPEEVMEELRCKDSTLKNLRHEGKLEWKHNGKGRGVMILRKSVEQFINQNSTLTKIKST